MTPTFLSKPGYCLLTALFVICLSGCKEDFALLDDSGKIVGKGVLETTANFPSPAHLTLEGKEYTGLWNETKIYEADVAKSRRLISARAYTAYENGNDPDQLKRGHASFTADTGSKIECDFYYRRQPGAGSCDIDGKQQLKLTVQKR